MSNLIIRIVDEIKLIDLSGGVGRFLQLKQLESKNLKYSYSMGFLPNGDLIIVVAGIDYPKLKYYKIFKYSFINKPTNTTSWEYFINKPANATSWEYSQTHDIHVENLNLHDNNRFIYKTKLFLISEDLMVQCDLLKMAFEMQYNLVDDQDIRYINIVITINKNQTLLALHHYDKYSDDKHIDVYSMKTGKFITRYG